VSQRTWHIYIPTIVQQDATIYSSFIPVNRSTCFVWYLHPTSGVHVTVSTASGTSKTVKWRWLDRNCSSRPVTFTTGCSYGFTNARCCGYSDMNSWCWVEVPHETCREVYRYKWTVFSCILLDNYWYIFRDARTLECKQVAYLLYCKTNSDVFLIVQTTSISPAYSVHVVTKHNSLSLSISLNRMTQFP